MSSKEALELLFKNVKENFEKRIRFINYDVPELETECYEQIKQDLERLEKAIEILKKFITISYCLNEETSKYDIPVMYSFGLSEKITQEEYELLKEVFND